MCVYVPTIHPWKQTVTERTALFIKSCRRATCSHRPRATRRPFRLSIRPLPPHWSFDWTYSKSNKYKWGSFTADLTIEIKSFIVVLYFLGQLSILFFLIDLTIALFYDFLLVLIIVKVTLALFETTTLNSKSFLLPAEQVCETLVSGWLTVCAGPPIRR